MNADRRYVAVAAIVGIFVLVQLGALALVEPFKSAGFQDVQNPSDPTNSLLYVGAILVATVVMLGAFRYGGDRVIRAVLVGSSGYLSFYVFAVLVPAAPLPGLAALAPAVALAGLVTGALWFYPEWYVIDAAGVVMGAGAAGLFGINFGVLPALVLLVVLAVYDAISVYGTEHMLTLAEGVMDLKVPVVLVVPLTLSYSFLDASPAAGGSDAEDDATVADGGDVAAEAGDDGSDTDAGDDGSDVGAGDDGSDVGADPDAAGDAVADGRDAFFIGLGDAVMPAVLIASAGFFAPVGVSSLVPGIALTLPALTAMVGTNLGLLALMYFVMQGRAHAGLPLLNGGAIGGYLVGALATGIPLVEALGLAPYL